jgi:hypothetical protein
MFGLGIMEIIILLVIALTIFVPIVILAIVLLVLSRQKKENTPDAEP